jgi:propanol-preferring alcohol dehydrogenase
MRAMVLERLHAPLVPRDVPDPEPPGQQLLIQVRACAVCRTDLHLIDGELPDPALPIIPGHEIVGRVAAVGPDVDRHRVGDRVGIPWLGWTCGECRYCRGGRENLCPEARFTGYQLNGGYAEMVLADQRYCFALPEAYDDVEAAPLLCAGLIGHRALAMAGEGRNLGIYGFGAAGHIVAQVAVHQGRHVFAFTRAGDRPTQHFARGLGAVWAGGSDEAPPEPLDAALIFAPAGELVPRALRALVPGGRVVCAGIHMSDIPGFPYAELWMERSVCSVANLTRADAERFLALAPLVPVRTTVKPYTLADANQALDDLRAGKLEGAAVLVPGRARATRRDSVS